MLDFGFSEILLTSAIALVVLGPERLPKVARQVGNWMGRARAMARQLSEQLEREVNAEELMRERTPGPASMANRIAPQQPPPLEPHPAPPDTHTAPAEPQGPLPNSPVTAAEPHSQPGIDLSKSPNE